MDRTEFLELRGAVHVGRDKAAGRSRRSLRRKRFAYSGLLRVLTGQNENY